jgi:hypothetical protein
VLGVAALVAAVVIPLAMGAGGRPATYRFEGNAAACQGAETVSFRVTLTNTAKTQNLGSADLYAPPNVKIDSAGALTLTGGGFPTSGPSPSVAVSQVNKAVPNDPTTAPRSLISLRSLQLPGGQTTPSAVTITGTATVMSAGKKYWYSIAKQANDFNPGDLDLSNAFTNELSTDPYINIATCTLQFAKSPPALWQKGTKLSPPVAVGLWDGTEYVDTSATAPTLSASGAGSIASFDGASNATSSTNPPIYTSATNTWSWPDLSPKLSATSGTYTLSASMGSLSTTSNPFEVVDCVPDTSGNCNSSGVTFNAGGDTGGSIQGTGINSPIVLSFESILPDEAKEICGEHWAWLPLTFPEQPDGRTNFDGITLSDFTYAPGATNGSLLLTTYLRNDLFVQTNPSNTNDIQICAGARHSIPENNTETVDGGVRGAFMGRGGVEAKWDTGSELYWGVLERIPNCNRARDLDGDDILDPALCGWGTQDVGGVLYRKATVLIPYDWDWKGIT